MDVFFCTDVHGSIFLTTEPVRDLEGERRLPDPGFSGEEDETPGREPVPEDRIELVALELDLDDRAPRGWEDAKNGSLLALERGTRSLLFGCLVRLIKGIPFTTLEALPLPFLTHIPTFTTSKHTHLERL